MFCGPAVNNAMECSNYALMQLCINNKAFDYINQDLYLLYLPRTLLDYTVPFYKMKLLKKNGSVQVLWPGVRV